jgi:DNA-binding transcriptional LysR family regulator
MSSAESLKGIAPFVYAADSGSFAAAAERLALTSSAVSKSVARLEERLGVRLFERTTRSLALTDAGAAFYETCVRILRELKSSNPWGAFASTCRRRLVVLPCCR